MADPVRVEGADEAIRAYQAIADDARDMGDAHRAIAAAGADAARARAPRATGSLAATIAGDSTDREATLSVGVPYWPFTEFGTRYLLGKRYLGAGIDAMERAAPDAYHARMAGIIGKRS